MTLLSETVSSAFINRSGGVYVTCFCLRRAKNRRTQRGLFTLCKKQAKKHYEQRLLHFKDHAHNSNNQPECCKQPKKSFLHTTHWYVNPLQSISLPLQSRELQPPCEWNVQRNVPCEILGLRTYKRPGAKLGYNTIARLRSRGRDRTIKL